MDVIQEHISFINQALGNNGVWKAKNFSNSNLASLLASIATVHAKIEIFSNEYFNQLNIYNATINTIDIWEKYVGIPDNVFTKTITLGIQDRIKQVVLKLVGFENITLPRLKYILKNIFDINNVSIKKGSQICSFPVIFGTFHFGTKLESRQDLYINLPSSLASNGFPFTFPFVFSESQKTTIESFIKSLVSFEYNVYFQYNLT